MFDLHLHTRYSDGDLTVTELVMLAKEKGLTGISLTDHNGIWGVQEAAQVAADNNITFIAGIEISTRFHGADVHILGYARQFNESILTDGLRTTRDGYAQRIAEMVRLCQAQGFDEINFAEIEQKRSAQINPSYISYDVAKQLQRVYDLPWDKVRALTVRGGACYVPYGNWAMTPSEAIALLHKAGAVAFIAHPGILVHEANHDVLLTLFEESVSHGLDGIEVQHPFHSQELINELNQYCSAHNLLISGGSDWHGPGRYHDTSFGTSGINKEEFAKINDRLPQP